MSKFKNKYDLYLIFKRILGTIFIRVHFKPCLINGRVCEMLKKIKLSLFLLLLVATSLSVAPRSAHALTAADIAKSAAAVLSDTNRAAQTAVNAASKALKVNLGNPINTALAKVDITLAQGWAIYNNFINKTLGLGACKDNGQLSDVICSVISSTSTLPGLVTALSYLFGVFLSVVALIKLKDHVIDPRQTPLSDSMKRFFVGGALFSLPLITEATQNLMSGAGAMSEVSGYAGYAGGGAGLDAMLVALFSDIYAPLMSLIFAFSYLAGLILVVVAVNRMLKTAQDGPRGPAGMGTIMSFFIAAVLFSLSSIMGAFSNSMFGDSTVATFAVLSTSSGDKAVDQHILAVISTVVVFLTIIGYISFVRGVFILKEVSEGSGQASLMAAVTHMFGGAIAVNVGPLMNAVQSTLGIDTVGVMFY